MSTEEQKIARIRELNAEIAAITVDYDAEIKRLEGLLALKKSIAGTATESRAVSSEKPTEKFEKCDNLLAYYRLCEKIEGMLSPEDHKLVETWITCSTRHNASKDGKVVPLQTHASLMEFQSRRVRDVLLKYVGHRVYGDARRFAARLNATWEAANTLLQYGSFYGRSDFDERHHRSLANWHISAAEFWSELGDVICELRTITQSPTVWEEINGILLDLHDHYGFDMSGYLMDYQAA